MGLTFSEVTFTYARGSSLEINAIESLSFGVETGELVLVLGVTGSGKSTMLRLAAGLLQPQSGSISLDDEPLTSATARGAVGLIFQDAESQLFADTVAQDVAFGPKNLGLSQAESMQAAHHALQMVGLDPAEFGSRSPFALSGGEARRAAIAGVLAMGPRYVLADEPTAGLDARGRELVRSLLLEARQEAGVIVVSHSAEEFLPHADRVLLLTEGHSAWWGMAEDLVQHPDLFSSAGLVAPDVLELQRLGGEKGTWVAPFALDVSEISRRLVDSAGSSGVRPGPQGADAE